VLEYYGESVHQKLADLADLIGISRTDDTDSLKSKRFIEAIKKLNHEMNIPNKLDCIQEHDLPLMVERAFQEANPLYPVPRILDKYDLYNIYEMIKE